MNQVINDFFFSLLLWSTDGKDDDDDEKCILELKVKEKKKKVEFPKKNHIQSVIINYTYGSIEEKL